MQKITPFFLILIVSVNSLKSQEGIASKGNNIVNAYYGVNLLTAAFKNVATNDRTNVSDLSIKSAGPIGIVYEHLMVDKIGLGAEISYASTTVSFKDFSANNQGQLIWYNYSYKFSAVRAMVRANFHFTNSEKFDAYGLVSAGYRGTSFTIKTDDPFLINNTSIGLIPFGIKLGVGFRYFFTEDIGANAEIALGTPLLSGGLSFKF